MSKWKQPSIWFEWDSKGQWWQGFSFERLPPDFVFLDLGLLSIQWDRAEGLEFYIWKICFYIGDKYYRNYVP